MLFSAGETVSEAVAVALGPRESSVTRPTMGTAGFSRMEAEHPPIDILVLDLSLDRPVEWDRLDHVNGAPSRKQESIRTQLRFLSVNEPRAARPGTGWASLQFLMRHCDFVAPVIDCRGNRPGGDEHVVR
jgi:hypothetical protein